MACGLRNFLHAHVYAAAVRPLSEYQYRTPSPVRLELGGQSKRDPPPRFSSFPPRSSIGEAVNANKRCKADADRLLLYSTSCTVHVHAGQKFKFRVLIAFKPRCRGCRQLPIFVHLSPITYHLCESPTPRLLRYSKSFSFDKPPKPFTPPSPGCHPCPNFNIETRDNILNLHIRQSDHDPQLHFPSSDACCAQS